MNIFCLIPRLTYTGAPKILAWLSNQLVKYGHTVTIVTIFKHEQFQELDEKIKIINLDFNQGDTWIKRNTIEMIKILYAFHKYVKKDKPDIIISFLDSVGLSYLFVNKLFGNSKMIVSERTDPYSGKKITAPLKKLLVSFADYVVFQTDGSMKFYDKKTQNKSIIIPNPVIISEDVKNLLQKAIPKFSDRENRIVSVGRMSIKQKRQDVLIEAFKIVNEKYPDLTLHFYGDGKDLPQVKKIAQESNLADKIFFHGHVKNVCQEIFNAKIFVLSSDYEGIPNALIESMLLGVPSISTDCRPGGARILIKDGVNGIISPKGDSRILSENIIRLLENNQLADSFTMQSPKISETFSEANIAQKWNDVLKLFS